MPPTSEEHVKLTVATSQVQKIFHGVDVLLFVLYLVHINCHQFMIFFVFEISREIVVPVL